MKLTKLLALTLTSAAVITAQAQTTSASSSKHELVMKILALQQTSVENLARSVGERPAMQLWQAALQAIQTQVPPEKREATAKTVQGHLKAFVDETGPQWSAQAAKLAPSTIGSVLESQMSEDDLKVLLAWVQSPVSKKYADLQPQLADALVKPLVEQLSPSMDPKLKALQQTVANDLGLKQGEAPATKKKKAQ